MKTEIENRVIRRDVYQKPTIEIVEIEMENVMALSSVEVSDDEYGGAAYSHKKNFWEEKQ